MRDFSVTSFGAAADGLSDDAPAIQRAIDTAFASGGGRVVIPPHTRVRAGHFLLRSRVELHIAEGAELLSATHLSAFPRKVFSSGDEADKRLWIGASGATDITLSGSGTINGQCHAFALGETAGLYTPTLPWRPALLCLENVRRLTIRSLLFRNSANWTLHLTGCQDVLIEDIRIFNDPRFPNADGIDPDHCQRVTIRRCHIISADDGIVLKNTAPFARYGPCEDIEISDCRIQSASAALKIGSESHSPFRRIRVRDCLIENSNRGIAVQLRDGASLSDAAFERVNISTRRHPAAFWGAAEPVSLTVLPRASSSPASLIHNLTFRDITCRSENGIVLCALPPGQIRGVRFHNVRLDLHDPSLPPPDPLDLRPFSPETAPPGSPASEPTPWGWLLHSPPAAILLKGPVQAGISGIQTHIAPGSRTRWLPLLRSP